MQKHESKSQFLRERFAVTIEKALLRDFGPGFRADIETVLKNRGLYPDSGSIFREAHRHPYPRGIVSDTFYIGDFRISTDDGESRVLIGYMGPYGKSTAHSHPGRVRERYISMGRGFTLILDGSERIQVRDEYVVEPERVHQVITEGESALYIIVMENVQGISDDLLHVHNPTSQDVFVANVNHASF